MFILLSADAAGVKSLSINVSPVRMSSDDFTAERKKLKKRIEFLQERVDYYEDQQKQQELRADTLVTALSGNASCVLDFQKRIETGEEQKNAGH